MKSIKHFYTFLIFYQIQAWVWPVTVENPVSKEKAIFRENNNHTWLYVVPYFAFNYCFLSMVNHFIYLSSNKEFGQYSSAWESE